MQRWRRGALLTVGAILLAGAPTTLHAQSGGEVERARELFTDGVALIAEERWAEAAQRFRAVREIRDTTAVRYNLAVTLEQTGQVVEAVELFRDVIGDESFDRANREEAERLLERAEARIARLTVQIVEPPDGGQVTIDDEVVDEASLSGPVSVDPGAHEVVLALDGEAIDSTTVTLGDGESRTVELDGTHASGDPDPALLQEEPTEPAEPSVFDQWWFWATAIGVVVVGVTVAVIAASVDGGSDPVSGNLQPGILEIEL